MLHIKQGPAALEERARDQNKPPERNTQRSNTQNARAVFQKKVKKQHRHSQRAEHELRICALIFFN